MLRRLRRLTYTQIIGFGFMTLVLLGGFVLCLPVSSRTGEWTNFIDALFTSTSATCVTGLSVYDTYSHWSLFGQLFILLLIQTGGLGFMTVLCMFSMLLRRNIGLHERRLIQQSAGAMQVGGVVALVRRAIAGTAICEGAGALLLSVSLCPRYGFWKGLYFSVFHSVSAFCNAGFDLFGSGGESVSLGDYSGNALVLLPIMALVVVGGLGFFVWEDLLDNRFNWGKLSLHTRLVLLGSGILLFGGAVCFFILERNTLLAGESFGERIVDSLFYSVTPRTAGFYIKPYAEMSEGGAMLTLFLMLIGGNSGSTAGGMKVTTLIVLVMSAVAAARRRPSVTVGKRRIEDDAVRQASSIAVIYLMVILAVSVLLCAIDGIELKAAAFEAVSAIATVGSSVGVTSSLSAFSKMLIMLLMFGGRVGGLSLALMLAEKRVHPPVERPVEKIMIG